MQELGAAGLQCFPHNSLHGALQVQTSTFKPHPEVSRRPWQAQMSTSRGPWWATAQRKAEMKIHNLSPCKERVPSCLSPFAAWDGWWDGLLLTGALCLAFSWRGQAVPSRETPCIRIKEEPGWDAELIHRGMPGSCISSHSPSPPISPRVVYLSRPSHSSTWIILTGQAGFITVPFPPPPEPAREMLVHGRLFSYHQLAPPWTTSPHKRRSPPGHARSICTLHTHFATTATHAHGPTTRLCRRGPHERVTLGELTGTCNTGTHVAGVQRYCPSGSPATASSLPVAHVRYLVLLRLHPSHRTLPCSSALPRTHRCGT